MARTTVYAKNIPNLTGLNITDLSNYDVAPGGGTGNGIQFKWEKNLLIFLRNYNDPGPLGFLIYARDTEVLAEGGLVWPQLIPAPAGTEDRIHILKSVKILKQDDGMVYIDASFSGYVLLLRI